MMTHCASGKVDVATLLQVGRYRRARGSPRSDDIDGKLLDNFCPHLPENPIILFWSLPLVHQRERALLIGSAGKSRRMGRGSLMASAACRFVRRSLFDIESKTVFTCNGSSRLSLRSLPLIPKSTTMRPSSSRNVIAQHPNT
jgi:hypothetical protein